MVSDADSSRGASASDLRRLVNMKIDTCDVGFYRSGIENYSNQRIEMFQSKYFRSSTSLMQSNAVFVLMSNIEKVLNQRRTHKKLHRLRCINGIFGSTGIIIRSIPQKPRTQTIRIDNHPNLVSVFLHRPVIMFPIRWWFVLFSCPCALRFAVLRWQSKALATLIIHVWGESRIA